MTQGVGNGARSLSPLERWFESKSHDHLEVVWRHACDELGCSQCSRGGKVPDVGTVPGHPIGGAREGRGRGLSSPCHLREPLGQTAHCSQGCHLCCCVPPRTGEFMTTQKTVSPDPGRDQPGTTQAAVAGWQLRRAPVSPTHCGSWGAEQGSPLYHRHRPVRHWGVLPGEGSGEPTATETAEDHGVVLGHCHPGEDTAGWHLAGAPRRSTRDVPGGSGQGSRWLRQRLCGQEAPVGQNHRPAGSCGRA